MTYQFPTKRKWRTPLETEPFEFSVAPDKQEQVGLIQGQVARSPEEWRVYIALVTLKRNFVYQYVIGPPGVRGSYYVDFYVEDVPRWFPLEVQSKRYHTGIFNKDERMRKEKIERFLKAQIRYVDELELTTQEDATAAVRECIYYPARRTTYRV